MTALEIGLLVSLCLVICGWVSLFISYLRLEKVCKALLKMNSDLFRDMIKLSELEVPNQSPFDEFKGENH